MQKDIHVWQSVSAFRNLESYLSANGLEIIKRTEEGEGTMVKEIDN